MWVSGDAKVSSSERTKHRDLTIRRVDAAGWLLVVTTAVLDVWSTYVGLEQGLVELNPVAAAIIATVGPLGLLPLKFGSLVAALGGWLTVVPPYNRIIPWSVGLLATVVVVHNFTLLV